MPPLCFQRMKKRQGSNRYELPGAAHTVFRVLSEKGVKPEIQAKGGGTFRTLPPPPNFIDSEGIQMINYRWFWPERQIEHKLVEEEEKGEAVWLRIPKSSLLVLKVQVDATHNIVFHTSLQNFSTSPKSLEFKMTAITLPRFKEPSTFSFVINTCKLSFL